MTLTMADMTSGQSPTPPDGPAAAGSVRADRPHRHVGGSGGARAFTARIQAMALAVVDDEPAATTRAGRDDLAAVRVLSTPAGAIHTAALNVRHDLVLAA